MTTTIHPQSDLIETAQTIQKQSSKILKRAYLTELQRQDLQAITIATTAFLDDTLANLNIIQSDDVEAKRHVRHQLRNHLNIIVGFSQIILKELPDNLLLHMAILRQIHQAGRDLITRVDSIQ